MYAISFSLKLKNRNDFDNPIAFVWFMMAGLGKPVNTQIIKYLIISL